VDLVAKEITGKEISSEGLYILKAVLVMAAYKDFTGAAAIATFLEFVVRPFILDYPDDFLEFKALVMSKTPHVATAVAHIQDAIAGILKRNIGVTYSERRIEEQLFEIHNFVNQNLDQFVRLVIILNERNPSEHPVVKMMSFVYAKADELDAYRNSSRSPTRR
jgi:hypothetical protein